MSDAKHASFRIGRRGLLLGLGATFALGRSRVAFGQAAGDRRLVVIILRGALDGLHAVQPYGDPGAAELRGALMLPEPGQEGGLLDLGGQFGLHPGFANLHAMYRANEALALHAVAGPHRSRSHFEAQDLLETGASRSMTSGWLNRALQAVPSAGPSRAGIAIGAGVPLLLRGPVPVGAYAPPGLDRPSEDLMYRLAELQGADPRLAAPFAEGMRARGFAMQTLGAPSNDPDRGSFPRLAAAAGRLLSESGGPRVAALELGGWDTHASQAGRIMGPLRLLDDGIGQLKTSLGAAWARTAVLIVTEFGRTARVNGNLGTDHGTGGVAFLLGGAVAGGRVVADWPGLAPGQLFENRDLQPTRDLRTIAKGLLRDHLRLPEAAVAQAFPDSRDAPPMAGLIRA
ncbi:DUF1501 domain-containing protein [Falsiroseomonas stagni]|uniref:Uncharacterized conserved protein, DUF1501 family n=1 Tax=Falsiroseomonas stagni DSM 19981 TaxID=1123062 RepID=A0A1I4C923_9PROT|nr:DUF1501 domain-containing protein [Falsiroseomonas stagni]SFK77130.1 Uncharacterized conserved protein, DUF1501 family [Falsiroseomonas stagni DSM 19981]